MLTHTTLPPSSRIDELMTHTAPVRHVVTTSIAVLDLRLLRSSPSATVPPVAGGHLHPVPDCDRACEGRESERRSETGAIGASWRAVPELRRSCGLPLMPCSGGRPARPAKPRLKRRGGGGTCTGGGAAPQLRLPPVGGGGSTNETRRGGEAA